MISCDTARSLLSSYLESKLNLDTNASIEQHLQNCPECQKVFKDVGSIRNRIQAFPAVATSPQFDQNLRDRIIDINEKETSSGARMISYGVTGAAVLAAAYFFVMADIFSFQESSETVPQKSIQEQTIENPMQKNNPDGPFVNEESNQINSPLADSLKNKDNRIQQERINLIDQER